MTREERVETIRSGRWIRYSRAEQILARLEALFTTPRSHRMPNLLLVGETNNGKTMIVNRFVKRHPPMANVDGDASCVPVFSMQAPPVPDEGRFYNAILSGIFVPFKLSARVDQKQFQVLRVLPQVGVRMLIIDEIHHVLAGTMLKQRHFLNVIKHLGNELQIPIVGVGTRDAFNAIHSDPQLANRFEPAILPRWQDDDELLRLLSSFEQALPLLHSSGLTKRSIALKILSLSEGTIGEISTLLTRAALYAIDNGTERITPTALERCGYVAPSQRKRMAV